MSSKYFAGNAVRKHLAVGLKTIIGPTGLVLLDFELELDFEDVSKIAAHIYVSWSVDMTSQHLA